MTSIDLGRSRLITKEEMESYCKGEQRQKDSVNDDLESLFENIRLGKEPDDQVYTYYLPKLTEEELELVERRDTSYFQSFLHSRNPDVDETEMMLSESDSKYVEGVSRRKTSVIENYKNTSENFYETSSESSTETVSENSSEYETLYRFGNSSENSAGNQSCLKNCCNFSLQ